MKIEKLISDAFDAAKRFINWILPSSKNLLDVALIVVNAMKEFDDNMPAIMDTVVALIPGTVDDVILAKTRQYLPELLVRLKWATNEANKTADEIVADAARYIKTLPKSEQAMAWQAIWQLLSNHLTDDAVVMPDLQKISQVYYEVSKPGK